MTHKTTYGYNAGHYNSKGWGATGKGSQAPSQGTKVCLQLISKASVINKQFNARPPEL